MKTLPSLFLPVFLLPSLAFAVTPQLMGGDERLACEAIMCLTNPIKPPECATSLRKFHSIKYKYGHDTINARRNFLKKCPMEDRTGFDEFVDMLVK
ncbi:TrbM/KikA/MpfK family conjugal transfer protein [Neisseria mucosa]|jgi:TrbM.|uniref:TrbM/KikA/MpfK family conjugal transfer protein n=1 Tax=Neisseria mucosa TaxID=488 RepID=UPI0008A23E8C|nr:TrbM/KikA/MpfK family conjugal transfer protein [Neisseria mucosa]OFJ56136.1 conjugal transfer protein TrbM [Neisseria sp. HMSC073B07]